MEATHWSERERIQKLERKKRTKHTAGIGSLSDVPVSDFQRASDLLLRQAFGGRCCRLRHPAVGNKHLLLARAPPYVLRGPDHTANPEHSSSPNPSNYVPPCFLPPPPPILSLAPPSINEADRGGRPTFRPGFNLLAWQAAARRGAQLLRAARREKCIYLRCSRAQRDWPRKQTDGGGESGRIIGEKTLRFRKPTPPPRTHTHIPATDNYAEGAPLYKRGINSPRWRKWALLSNEAIRAVHHPKY